MTKRTSEQWVKAYASSHKNPVNKALHLLGIPMIALSVLLFFLSLEWGHLFWVALTLFSGGWVLQFVGHAFEGKQPGFFNDWRFLFVGLRWWFSNIGELARKLV